jgi:hypothetical protein
MFMSYVNTALPKNQQEHKSTVLFKVNTRKNKTNFTHYI